MSKWYPPVKVQADYPGEIIVITSRPHQYQLGPNDSLTGDFRIPKEGEYYWYTPTSHSDTEGIREQIKPRRCTGRALLRYHIIRRRALKVTIWDEENATWRKVSRSAMLRAIAQQPAGEDS